MLTFQNISKIYYSSNQTITALEGISFSLNKGEIVSVVGESGAGKTTLVKLITAEEKPTSGRILFGNIDINKLRSSALQKIRKKIGIVHQDYKLLQGKTVKENLSYVMQVIGAADRSIKRDVPIVLKLVGLSQRADNFPCQLSGGEKQRLAIAKALIHRPEIIVADEPTGNLDFKNTCQVIDIFKKVNSQQNYSPAIILCTHDKYLVEQLGSRVISLEKGRIVG